MKKEIRYQDKRYRIHQKSNEEEQFIFFPAALRFRIAAYLVDVVVLLAIFFGAHMVLQIIGIDYVGLPPEMITSSERSLFIFHWYYYLAVGGFSILQLIYFTSLEYMKGTSTFGKKLFNLKVLGKYGDVLGLKKSFGRNVFRLLWPVPSFFFGLLAGIWKVPYIAFVGGVILIIDIVLMVLIDQRLGDRLTSTFVLNTAEPHKGLDKEHLKNAELLSKKW